MITDWREQLTAARAEQCLVGTEFLLDLVKELKPKTYVETGCGHLATFRVYSSYVEDSGLAIGVDLRDYPTWPGYVGPLGRENKKFVRSFLTTGGVQDTYARNQLIERLIGRQIDLLFIDGDHSEQGVRDDWEFFKGFLRPGALVIFHDYDPVAVFRDGHRDGQGAAILCAELEKQGQTIQKVPTSSIGTAYMYWRP